MNRKFIVAMLLFAALAVAVFLRLDGRPRIAAWLVLGLFAVKTLLAVLKQTAD